MDFIKQGLALSLIFILLSCTLSTKPSNENEDNEWLQSDNEILPIQVYYLGHSLISDVNDMAMSILNDIEEDSFTFDEQEIPGCPLSWHWDETQAGGSDPFISDREIHMRQLHEALDSGDYSHIVITDSMPRGGSDMETETVDYMSRILLRARAARSDVRLYYYETWHHRDSGTPERINDPEEQATGPNPNRELAWLPRLQADALMWERIVETVNQNHPPGLGEFPAKLIPAGRVLGAVVEAAEGGSIPGFSGIEDFFGRVAVYNENDEQIFDGDEPLTDPDFIHLNYYGKYIIASIHAAVLSGRTPEGYTFDVYTIHGASYWDTPNWWGYSQSRPDEESIQVFQQIIADELNELYDPE